jgi:hypothetical protein
MDMRQSEVEQLVHRYGHERGIYHAVLRLAEEQRMLENSVKEMALAFEQIATVISMQNTVMDKTKDKIDAMGRHFDTDARSTHAIVRSMGTEEDE